jgi:hypothetical protein
VRRKRKRREKENFKGIKCVYININPPATTASMPAPTVSRPAAPLDEALAAAVAVLVEETPVVVVVVLLLALLDPLVLPTY